MSTLNIGNKLSSFFNKLSFAKNHKSQNIIIFFKFNKLCSFPKFSGKSGHLYTNYS